MNSINTEKINPLNHKQHKANLKKYNLNLLASHLNTPENIGSLFRLADALGLKKIYLSGTSPIPPNKKIKKTSRSTEKFVCYQTVEDELELITQLKKQGTYIIALELCKQSVNLSSEKFKRIIKTKPSLLLMVGNEKSGIAEPLLKMADIITFITMQGNNSSMNVAMATSIACYEITKQMKT